MSAQPVSTENPAESPADITGFTQCRFPNDGSVESPVADAPRRGDVDVQNKAPTAPVVNDDTDAVEEMTVTGRRIRRWLPFVGAAWPDENCQLSTRDVGRGRAPHGVHRGPWPKRQEPGAALLSCLARAAGGPMLVTLPGSDGDSTVYVAGGRAFARDRIGGFT